MKPTIDELHNSGRYELIDSFKIDDMGQFLMRELGMKAAPIEPKKAVKSWTTWAFLGGFILAGAAFGYWIGAQVGKASNESAELKRVTDPLIEGGGQASFAFLAFFLLLPIHELIHAAVFKYYKAPKVGFGWSWKSMVAYAYAQNFVHDTRELFWIAVMPFLIISAGLGIGWVILPQYGVFWGVTLFIHTTACIGDFVLMNYHRKNRHRGVYTYDDIENEKRSYFFATRA
ncbi:MAG: DUF3267 domain-containing protein [Cytophagales bacterium]|nr:MAG: DUF3267 domain-containing protein [Cytophagales bacterium]